MAQGVLLERGRRPQRSLTILVPRGHEEAPPAIFGHCWVCLAVLGKETIFHAGEEQAWERHVGECARKHLDEIRALAPSHVDAGGPFDPNNWDPEVDEHMRGVGRRMLKEGRWEVKPHERAGLS